MQVKTGMLMSNVILVNENNEPIGKADKLQAHLKGWCHRAFSIFIFKKTSYGLSILLQKRAISKYHSGGLWSNTCCSHPQPKEKLTVAAKKRLFFEMGFNAELTQAGLFHYRTQFDNGLVENEWDYVFTGFYHGEKIKPNTAEVDSYRFEDAILLRKKINDSPNDYTVWLSPAFEIALSCILTNIRRGPKPLNNDR